MEKGCLRSLSGEYYLLIHPEIMTQKALGLLGFLLFGYSLFWIYDHYFLKVFERSLDAVVENSPRIEVQKILVQSFNRKGLVKFEIYGARGEVREKEGITEVSPIHMIIYDDEIPFKRETTILAREGYHFRSQPPYFELVGGVELNTQGDQASSKDESQLRKLFTEKLLYYPDLEKFVSPGSFKIIDTSTASIATGEHFEYHSREEKGEVKGGFELRTQLGEDVILQELNRGLSNEI